MSSPTLSALLADTIAALRKALATIEEVLDDDDEEFQLFHAYAFTFCLTVSDSAADSPADDSSLWAEVSKGLDGEACAQSSSQFC